MANTLDRAIQDIYSGWCRRGGRTQGFHMHPRNLVFMSAEIGDTFEIPVVMLNTLEDVKDSMTRNQRFSSGEIAVPLWYCGSRPYYVSFDAAIKSALTTRLDGTQLIMINVKQGDETIPYYITQGMIFDWQMAPVLACTVECKKVIKPDDNGTERVIFEGSKLIVRISPNCFIGKSNQIERYVSNKFPSTFLGVYHIGTPVCVNRTRTLQKEVIVSNSWPFKMTRPRVPESGIDNKELLQVAIDHIDDVFP